jgi:hypothetical protein
VGAQEVTKEILRRKGGCGEAAHHSHISISSISASVWMSYPREEGAPVTPLASPIGRGSKFRPSAFRCDQLI